MKKIKKTTWVTAKKHIFKSGSSEKIFLSSHANKMPSTEDLIVNLYGTLPDMNE